MNEENHAEYFTNDTLGRSQSIPKMIYDNIESFKMSAINARGRQYDTLPLQTLTLDGIPGLPADRGEPNPDLFYQGEDAIFDLFLYMNGKPVVPADYEILARVKTSPRAFQLVWEGKLDNGIYPVDDNRPGYYELWISSECTKKLLAGTYHLDISVNERIGDGKGKHDRKFILLQHYFSVEYSNFSEHPETMSNKGESSKRSDAEPTWPNSTNTIGR